eukprot:tig00000404_g398.t1
MSLSISATPAPGDYGAGFPSLRRGQPGRRTLYDSLESLHTMRTSLGTPLYRDAGATLLKSAHREFHKRRWKEGAGILLKSLAHNSDDRVAANGFRGAVEHIQRNRMFFDPGFRRANTDYGVTNFVRRPKQEEPPPEDNKPKRKIVDDFPDVWRQARMEEVLKSRGAKSARTNDGCAPISGDVELEELKNTIHEHFYIPIRTIFRYYARLDGAKVKSIAVRARKLDNDEMYTVSKHEFDAFIGDCKLLDTGKGANTSRNPHALTGPRVNLVFIMANKEPGKSQEEAQLLASDANNKLTMVLPEFLQAIVRLAEIKYFKAAPSLAERVTLIMENDVLPNARWDDVEEFRRLMKKDEVQDAITNARGTMRKLFDKYSALDSHAARMYGSVRNKSVSIREFVAMFNDLGLLQDRTLSQKDVQDAFATAQADPVIDDEVTTANDATKGNLEELNSEEFEEAMVRCAVSRYCTMQSGSGGGTTARNPLATQRSLATHRTGKKSARSGAASPEGGRSPRRNSNGTTPPPSEGALPPVNKASPPTSQPNSSSNLAGENRRVSIQIDTIAPPPLPIPDAPGSLTGEDEAGEEKDGELSPGEVSEAINEFFDLIEDALLPRKKGAPGTSASPVPPQESPSPTPSKSLAGSKSTPAMPTLSKSNGGTRSLATLPPAITSPTPAKAALLVANSAPPGLLDGPKPFLAEGAKPPTLAPIAAALSTTGAAPAAAGGRRTSNSGAPRRASLTVPVMY